MIGVTSSRITCCMFSNRPLIDNIARLQPLKDRNSPLDYPCARKIIANERRKKKIAVKKTRDGDIVGQCRGCVYSLAFITGFAEKDCRVPLYSG